MIRPARCLAIVVLGASCGPAARQPPSEEQARLTTWTFIGPERRGERQAAWATLGACDVRQASDTIFPTTEVQIQWRLASHDTTLVLIEYDVLGDIYPAARRGAAGTGPLVFRPNTRRVSELFAVVWDSTGQPALACGLHQANHIDAFRFHSDMFWTGDSSRMKWDKVRPRP